MGKFNELDIAIQEISNNKREYEENKSMLSAYLLSGNKKHLSLKLKGFWREYQRQKK